MISRFVDCIVNDTSSPVLGEEGMKSLEVTLVVLEFCEMKKVVQLS